jgi:secondary thiamine-phosphate synthase enzyme
VVTDLKKAIHRMAPQNISYAHELAWHDGNGHSHVQAAIMGPFIIVPLRSGKLQLGTWQQVVAVNHDNRARQRRKAVSKKCFSQFVLGRLVHTPEPWVVYALVPASFDHADLG